MKELLLKNCRLDGRYDLTEVLGRGSYSEIFVGRDTFSAPGSPHHYVVIKALNVFLQGDLDVELEKTLVDNFRNEAVALDRVRHPNILSRLGHGSARDLNGLIFHYLVLEYLAGGDLFKLCKNRGLPFGKTLEYLEQICSGLSHAHSQNIIHRDIKPQNLLLTADKKTVKICDFGVARLSASDDPITRVGTNIYAPPEHSPMMVDSELFVARQLTPSADIYSLAKSAYVMITGESPRRFTGAPISDLPEQYRDEPWAEGLVQVLRKATQFAPSLRHQSVTEFWQDLVRVKIASESDAHVKSLEQIAIPADIKPKSYVSSGYVPVAPEKPKFNTSRELKLKDVTGKDDTRLKIVIQTNPAEMAAMKKAPNGSLNKNYRPENGINVEISPQASQRNSRRATRRAVALIVALLLFSGVLYGTYNVVRGSGATLYGIMGWYQTGTANSDINLRPESNARKDAIGLVPKDSRLRIVNSTENWYEVDIIEYGRPKQDPGFADHGWVNKQYVDLR